MRINIEDGVKAVTSLFFKNHRPSDDPNALTSITYSASRINEIIIPIYQRNYDWDEAEVFTLLNNTENYIRSKKNNKDLERYFTGTILIQCEKEDDKKSDKIELIDGQQRLTTCYLMLILAYKASIESRKHVNLDKFGNSELIIENQNRYNRILEIENKIFTKHTIKEEFNRIFETRFADYNEDDKSEIIEERLDLAKNLGVHFDSVISHKNDSQRIKFIDAIKNTNITENIKSQTLELKPLRDNPFSERMSDIFNFFADLYSIQIKQSPNQSYSQDSFIEFLLSKIKSYCELISFCVIVSENDKDSFDLFEVLNGTGRKLTLIDKLKNYLYNNTELSPRDEKFNLEWAKLNKYQENSSKYPDLATDVARSENFTMSKDYLYDYFRNNPNPDIKTQKSTLFKEESSDSLLARLIYSSRLLTSIHSKKKAIYDHRINPGSIEWNLKIISELRYDWGRQVFHSSYLLNKASNTGFLFNEDGSIKPLWKEKNPKSEELTSNEIFQIFLSDILAKIGLIGIINKLSTNVLPKISKDILGLIHDFVSNSNQNFNKLVEDITMHFINYASNQQSLFEYNIQNLSYDYRTHQKHIRLLLYILYNKGHNSTWNFIDPQIEHLEPKTPDSTKNAQYFKNENRDLIINSFGNLILLPKNINVSLKNLTVLEKLEKVREKTDQGFAHPIFQNLYPKNNSNIGHFYINMPSASNYYDDNGAPTEYFFEKRNKFYVENLTKMIFDPAFLISGIRYDEVIFTEQPVAV